MMSTNNYTTLDLLRHGQLETPGIFCADAKAPLSHLGMTNLNTATKTGYWDLIISSPQMRCREFAEQLSESKQCELLIDKRFKEMNFGDWIGIKSETLWQDYNEQYQQLWEAPDEFTAPNGESMQTFFQTVQLGLREVLKEHANKSILLITHAGVIRTILSNTLEISTQSVLKFNIGYAQMNRLHCYPDGHYSLEYLGKKG